MLVLRNAITRPYWTQMQVYVLNRMQRCESHPVLPSIWRLDSGQRIKIYYSVDGNGFPASWLYLKRKYGWCAWEVAQIWTFPKHRGRRLAEKLYKAAINTDELLLATGSLHTQYSQAMWKGFIKRKLFNVWAHDFRHLEKTAEVYVEDDEIECELTIYVKPALSAISDVRLLALRKV